MTAKHKRVASTSSLSSRELKRPRIGIFPNEQIQPEFKADRMDMEGPWGWSNFDIFNLPDLFTKIFNLQKLTWQTLGTNGSHAVEVSHLATDAKKRLIEIKMDDLDQLYSLRLTGQKRIWSIKEGNILWILWWDPFHQVCPSAKKHT